MPKITFLQSYTGHYQDNFSAQDCTPVYLPFKYKKYKKNNN